MSEPDFPRFAKTGLAAAQEPLPRRRVHRLTAEERILITRIVAWATLCSAVSALLQAL